MKDDFLELDRQVLRKICNRAMLDYLEHQEKMQKALDPKAISGKEYIRRIQKLEFYDIFFQVASGKDIEDLDEIVEQYLALIRSGD